MEFVFLAIFGLIALSGTIIAMYELISNFKVRLSGKRTLQVIGLDEDLKFQPTLENPFRPTRPGIVYRNGKPDDVNSKILVIENQDGPVIPLNVSSRVYGDVKDILTANKSSELHLDAYVDDKHLTIKKVFDYRVRSNPDPVRYRTHYASQSRCSCEPVESSSLTLSGLQPNRF